MDIDDSLMINLSMPKNSFTQDEFKNLIGSFVTSMSHIAEKQAIILELLSVKLELSASERENLLKSAQENRQNIETLRQALQTW